MSGKERFAACGGKRGSRPRPLRWAASLPPLAACGPLSLPALGGGVAPPAPPAVAVGDMWRPRPRLRRVPVKLAASRCAGAPFRNARPSPCGAGRWPGLALLLPRAGCGAGAPARPAPTMWGLWGVARLRPGRRRFGPRPGFGHALRGLRYGRPAFALADRRSGPLSLAAYRRQAGPAPCGPRCGPCPCGGRNFNAARWGRTSAAFPRVARGWGAGKRRLRAGRPRLRTPVKGKMYRAMRGP